MITPQGTVKVMDFGIARAVSDSAATMTSTAAVIGTAQYLSPEQARGEGVDARSDVYSMGCMLYELVTGAPPFTGDSPVSVAYQHVREDPRLPSSINRDIPAELDAILLKAMSKNPANRYQSAADMRNDLLRALAGQRVEATPVMGDAEKTAIIGAPPGGYGPAGYGYRDDGDWGDDEHARRRKRRIIAIVSVLALLLLGGVIAAAIALRSDPQPPPAAKVAVPVVAGMDEATARAAIEDAGLVVGAVSTEASPTVPEGQVIRSDPAGGAQVDEGDTVGLVVSGGPDTITVPNVVGLTEDRAVSTLEAAGFTDITTAPADSLEDEGTVVGISPDENTQAAPSAPIRLQISTGTIEVPDVTGRTEGEARDALVEAGFSAGQISTSSVERDDAPQGTVVGTDPEAGTAVGAGEDIVLLVAVPTPPEPTPTTPTETPTTPATTTPSVPGG
jgi:serine/threonine-protein kinase